MADGMAEIKQGRAGSIRELEDANSRWRRRVAALPVYQARHVTLSCGSYNLHLDDQVWPEQRAGGDPILVDLTVEPKR